MLPYYAQICREVDMKARATVVALVVLFGAACAGKHAPQTAPGRTSVGAPEEDFATSFERFWWIGPALRNIANAGSIHTHTLGLLGGSAKTILLVPPDAEVDVAQVPVIYTIAVIAKGAHVPPTTDAHAYKELLLEPETSGGGYRTRYTVYVGTRFDARTMKIPDEPAGESVDERRIDASQGVFTCASGGAPKPDTFFLSEFEPEVDELVKFLDWYEKNNHPTPKKREPTRSTPAVASR
jgi:hypothetical protein